MCIRDRSVAVGAEAMIRVTKGFYVFIFQPGKMSVQRPVKIFAITFPQGDADSEAENAVNDGLFAV